MSKVSDMVAYHLKKEKIVWKHVHKNEETGLIDESYIIRSILRSDQGYNVSKDEEEWSCDCKSFKYRSGTNKLGHCKHIMFILFLIDNNLNIEVIDG